MQNTCLSRFARVGLVVLTELLASSLGEAASTCNQFDQMEEALKIVVDTGPAPATSGDPQALPAEEPGETPECPWAWDMLPPGRRPESIIRCSIPAQE